MKTPPALTSKQRAILDFIHGFVAENQGAPSFREIGAHFDLSVGTVQDQVEALRRKGFLEKDEMRARSIRVPLSAREIPVLGHVHAGPLHPAIEDVEGHIAVGKAIDIRSHFALRVRGDSMIEAGILEGDLVIVRSTAAAGDGDIVVARIEDEVTVKRYRVHAGRPELHPANAAYRPIRSPFEIVGVVVELRRRYDGRRI